MKKILLLLMLGLAALGQRANASIVFNIDTPTELEGTFSVTGLGGQNTSPISFLGLLPGPEDEQFVTAIRFHHQFVIVPSFNTHGTGTPDNPSLQQEFINQITPGGPLPIRSGSYSNDPEGLLVDFLITGFETGNFDGTFSGAFDFKVHGTGPVSDGGSSALMLGGAMLGFLCFRKRLGRGESVSP
jgi:hypothetical protein